MLVVVWQLLMSKALDVVDVEHIFLPKKLLRFVQSLAYIDAIYAGDFYLINK